MTFQVLMTSSLKRGDMSYVRRIPRELADDSELAAIDWINEYERKHGALPTPARAAREDSTLPFVDKAFTSSDPLSDLFSSTISRMKWRLFLSRIRQIEDEELPDGSLDTGALRELTALVSADYNMMPISFADFDRDTLYDVNSGHSVKLGYPVIDTFIGGLFGGECLFVVARPGRGKTMLVCDMAIRWAQQGERVAFNSIEMPISAIVSRLDALLGEFNPMLLRMKDNEPELQSAKAKVKARLSAFTDGDILFPSRYCPTPSSFESFCQECGATIGISDGLYLMKPDVGVHASSRDWQSIAGITGGFKEVARNLDIPIIGTTQLKRNGEENADIDDIAFSDAFGQDADVVLAMVPSGSEIHIKLAKNRNGKQGHGQMITLDIENGRVIPEAHTDM